MDSIKLLTFSSYMFLLQIEEDFRDFFNKPANLFSQSWPSVAAKIIALAKSKTTNVEIKEILKSNKSLLASGLFLLKIHSNR